MLMILTYLDQKKDFLLACMGTYRAELDFQAIGVMPSFSTQKTAGIFSSRGLPIYFSDLF